MERERGSPRTWVRRRPLLAALVCSALLHVGFALFVREVPLPPPPRPPPTTITLNFESAAPNARASDDPNARASNARTRTPADKQPPPDVKDDPKPDKQLVKLPPPKKPQPPPEKARFLSEHDQRAEEETRARKTSATAAAANTYKDEKETSGEDAEETDAEEPAPADDAEGGGEGGREALHLPRLGVGTLGAGGGLMGLWRASQQGQNGAGLLGGTDFAEADGAGSGENDDGEGPEAPGPRGGVLPDARGLMLSDKAASRIAGGAPANDAIPEDIPEGSGVFLNAEQWKYASYFNRVTDAVRRRWRPGDVLRRREDDPILRRSRKRQTLVEVTLGREGQVLRVRVDRYSGVDYLDDEALRAMRAAGPFPNPPPGLFEAGKDEFTFRFGFQVNFEDGPRLPIIPGFGGR